jgi:hypothetical protein
MEGWRSFIGAGEVFSPEERVLPWFPALFHCGTIRYNRFHHISKERV